MDKEKIVNFKELIDSLDANYYTEQNKKIEKEIENIEMGRSRKEGIYPSASSIVPKKQVEKEIEKLKNQMKENKKASEKAVYAISQLKTATSELESLAEKEALLNGLREVLMLRNGSKTMKTDAFKANKGKYNKLHSKSKKKITQPRTKISKQVYELIKKNTRLRVVHSSLDVYRSLGSTLKENQMEIKGKDTASSIMFTDVHKEYEYFDSLSKLGVDVSSINKAMECIQGEPHIESLTWDGAECLKKLIAIETFKTKKFEIKGGSDILNKLESQYKEIIELSRETWYVEKILDGFKDTVITDSEMYKGLQNLVIEQKEELSKLISKADKIYEKSGFQSKIDLIEKLENLYRQIQELKSRIEHYEKMSNYDQSEYMKEDYNKLRYEMIKILKDNPDLNKSEYNIDINNIIKLEMKLFEPEIKKEMKIEESSHIKNNEEIPNYLRTPEEEIFIDKSNIEKSDVVESLELDSKLQIQRTMHYQEYMRQKVINSDLGKLSFSQYLESVAPNLTKLINIEKERERLARTIYKDYVKYLSSLENKKDAISFYKFSENNYSISNIDVPIEYEEEYKGMKI